MADNLRDLEKQLQSLRSEYERLSKKPAAVFDVSNIEKAQRAIEQMEGAVDRARETAYKMSQGFVGIREELEGVLNGLGDSDSAIKKATRSLRKIKNIYEDLENDQLGISRLNLKDLKTLDKKNQSEQKYLKLQISELKGRKELTDEEAEALALAEQDYAILVKGNEKLKDRLDKEKEINKTIGLTGAAFKGISGSLSKIGVDSEALSGINKDIYTTAERGGSSFQVMGTAIKGSAGVLKDALLNDALVQLVVVQKIYSAIFNILSHTSEATFKLSQNLATSNKNAAEAYSQIKSFSKSAQESSTTFNRILEANSSLNQSLGTSVVFSQQQLETQSKLVNVVGLSGDEASRVLMLSLEQGKSQEEIVDGIRSQSKGLVNANDILKTVINASGQLGFNYRTQTDQLARSVRQAKLLGITLEDSKGISSQLLDFESSISSELEAELLTGKNLNFERARQLALQGKSVEAAIEVRKQVGSAAEFGKMNVIQQEALAKAAGMTVDQLSDSLRKEEQLQTLADRKNITLTEAAKLREQEEAASQKLANAGDRLKTSFTSLIAKFTPLIEKFADFIDNLSRNESLNTFISGLGAVSTGIGAIGSIGLVLRTLLKGRRGGRNNPMHVILSGMGKGIGKLSKGVSKAVGKSFRGLGKLLGGAKTIAGKAAGGISKVASKAGGKGLAKLGAKALGKGLLKKIPGVGLLAGVGFGLQRALKGDLAGAALELASGAASTLPGLGTAASVGLDAALAARDIKQASSSPRAMATGGMVTKPINAIVGEAGPEAVIPLNEFYKKFDELISVVKSGGNVYLDGNKVGTVLSMVPVKA